MELRTTAYQRHVTTLVADNERHVIAVVADHRQKAAMIDQFQSIMTNQFMAQHSLQEQITNLQTLLNEERATGAALADSVRAEITAAVNAKHGHLVCLPTVDHLVVIGH